MKLAGQPLRLRLDQRGQFVERHPPAGFVVGGRDARRQVIVDSQHLCAAVRFGERKEVR